MNDLAALQRSQREFFRTGATHDLDFRERQLRRLLDAVLKHERDIFAALKSDMGKPEYEAYIGEVGYVRQDLKHALKHFRSWARPRRVGTPLLYFRATSYIIPEPLGEVLIIGPWNYPYQLLIAPLVGAIAAGNTAILKPSEMAPATAALVTKIVAETFEPNYIACIQGGVPETTALLELKHDHIFFTGSTAVGKVIMTAAAKHLTPVTLELGGKSPCIVDRDTDLAVTARRITWGKFLNAGQTCIAPDYLLVHKDVKAPLIEHMRRDLELFYGKDPLRSPDYARVINRRHFGRLKALLGAGRVIIGGRMDEEKATLEPTLIEGVTPDDPVMQEEIFGPILPVIEYSELDEAIRRVQDQPKPLALYFFSNDAAKQKRVLRDLSFGGGCINDALMHFGSPNLPFGGVGESGMGAYHGDLSFEAFSHRKAVMKRAFFPDLSLRYPPYKGKLSVLRRFLG